MKLEGSGSPWDLSSNCKQRRKLSKISWWSVRSDSYKLGITREKELAKRSTKSLFWKYLGFQRAMYWNFQIVNVKCMDKHVEQNDGRKSWVKKQNSNKEQSVQKEWACLQSFCSFSFHCLSVLKAGQQPAQLRQIKAILSSDSSEIGKQESQTGSWTSLAWAAWLLWLNLSYYFVPVSIIVLHSKHLLSILFVLQNQLMDPLLELDQKSSG